MSRGSRSIFASSRRLIFRGRPVWLMLMDRKEGENMALGEAFIAPLEPVVAGSYGCWRLTYRVGVGGMSVGGGIKVGTDSDSDWGDPQFHDPAGSDYMSVTIEGRATVSTVLEGGYMRRRLTVNVHEHPLVEGDEITIVYGDRSRGGPGSRAQTFAEERRYFRVYVDSSGDGCFAAMPNPPLLQVVGGSVARLSVRAPSQVGVGEPFSVVVIMMDEWGNPSYAYDGTISLEGVDDAVPLPQAHVFNRDEHGVHRFDGLTVLSPGVYRIRGQDARNGLNGASNPIICTSHSEAYTLYWGDLHGQVKSADKISEYFRFARDISGLDFASHQRNDHEVSKSDWEVTQQVVKECNTPGRFIVFLGYEWSGEPAVGGDHNIYYLDDDQPIRRSGHEMVDDKSDQATDLLHIQDVYRAFQRQRLLIVPHVGGRPANLSFHDPVLESVIEVHSTHGTFEWFLREALERGYKVGFIAGSDDYKLRLGGAYPGIGDRRFVRGGLTAVYARGLTRVDVFEALKSRRCYGTTGERILLKVYADGHTMGEEYTTQAPPEISVKVIGTKELETVEVFRGLQKVYEYPPPSSSAKPSKRVKISWGGASRKTPYAGVKWEGDVRVEQGSISSLDFMPLDRGDEEFNDVTETGFHWQTFTCGDEDGASFDVDSETAEIQVTCTSTPVASAQVGTGRRICAPTNQVDRVCFRFHMKELGSEPKIIELGPVERRIRIRRLPEKTGRMEVEFKFIDTGFESGVNAYWIRVVQSDGEMAWSSPIYVNRVS